MGIPASEEVIERIEHSLKYQNPSSATVCTLQSQMQYRLSQNNGEAYYLIGADTFGNSLNLTPAQHKRAFQVVSQLARLSGAKALLLSEEEEVSRILVRRPSSVFLKVHGDSRVIAKAAKGIARRVVFSAESIYQAIVLKEETLPEIKKSFPVFVVVCGSNCDLAIDYIQESFPEKIYMSVDSEEDARLFARVFKTENILPVFFEDSTNYLRVFLELLPSV